MPPRVRIRNGVALAAIGTAVALTQAATGHAAFTAAYGGGGTATLEGSNLSETLIVGVDAGVVTHNQTGSGFASTRDWDTSLAGEQTIPANGTVGIEVFGFGGADILDMRGAGTAIDGDSLHGGKGEDRLYSTPDREFITGGEGGDLIVPGEGADEVDAGPGDDLVIWRDGDGDDEISGGEGDDEVAAIGGAAGETFVIGPGPGGPSGDDVTLDRTAPSAVTLSVARTELIVLDARDGADAITAGAGLAALTTLSLFGGDGPDAITGGDGPDTLDAGSGDDVVAALDGIGDVVRCGPGSDTATLDPGGLDQHSGCEEINGKKIRPIRLGPVQLPAARARLRKNLVLIAVSCPATATAGCRGAIALESAGVHLGSARFGLRAGARRTVRVRVPAAARLLAPRGSRTLQARALIQDRNGALRTRRIAIAIPRRG